MNYLAHIYLAGDNEKNMLGNFLGDFVKINEINDFEESIKKGIIMHRKIDSFTDNHYDFLKSKSRISNSNKRFAGLLIDIFYDHFLAKNWNTFSLIPLEEYLINFYKILKEHFCCLPNKLKDILPIMIEENWLLSYKNIDGIEKALGRITRRISMPNYSLETAIDDLIERYHDLENDFKSFFPLAITYAKQLQL